MLTTTRSLQTPLLEIVLLVIDTDKKVKGPFYYLASQLIKS